MSMRGAVTGCLVLVCLLVLLAERAEGHITFFSPKEMMVLKEQEGKKFVEPRSEDEQFEEVTVQQLPQDKTDKTVAIAIHLSPQQLDHAVPVLEEIIKEMVEKAK
ncbi:motilin-like isoform X2 [Takifugu rubripes]|uniref:motilin-like isoform X2 n=1 Tax=Takifugu rubripes TaxID=31033 RepID=UPI001145B264|nr:uncharacterized protein LOC115246849 isoform X2 [Takifugu rubripes]XP_056886558.1 motilin-like isoform X2 [Takifugu flavidus]